MNSTEKKIIADTVVYGNIYTSNSKQEVAQAFAVKDGKYIYVGNKEGAEAYIGSDTKVIDQKTGMILAGSTEGHGHYIMQSVVKFWIPAVGTSLEALKPAIEAYMAEYPDKKAYVGFGFIRENDLVPNAEIDYTEYLDALCSDKPLILVDNDGHQVVANTKALEIVFDAAKAKILDPEKDRTDKKSIPGGIVRRLADGRANGYLQDQACLSAMRLIGDLSLSDAEYDMAMLDMQNILYRQGYTYYNDGLTNATGMAIADAMYRADEEGKIKVMLFPNYMPLVYELQDKAIFQKYIDDIAESHKIESKHILPAGVKVFADGVTESQTGYNDIPYVGTDNYGNVVTDEETIYKVTKAANERGISVHSHSYGNAAIHYTIDAFVKAQNEVNNGTRNTMCHTKNMFKEDFKRMVDNNIAIALNINWHKPYTKEIAAMVSELTLEPECLIHEGYPTGDCIKYGVVTASSTDAPAHNDSPTDVFGILELAVNPKSLGYLEGFPEFLREKFISIGYTKENLDNSELTNAHQCVPVKDGLDIMTINGAKLMGIEKERGSIEVGKYADFVFADQNILNCSLDDIHKTKVERVFFEGEEVYKQ